MKYLKKMLTCIMIASCILILLPMSQKVQAASNTVIMLGNNGIHVAELQSKLKSLGYYKFWRITGYYGAITTDSVMKFQRDYNLHVDGIAGDKTLSKIDQLTNRDFETYYTVVAGDSLFNISFAYGISIKDLKTLNGLTLDTIYPGKVLKIKYQKVMPVNAQLSQNENIDLYWLSRIIEAEAAGEPYIGKVAVGSVIINRKSSSAFPGTIKDVIFEYYHGIPQFSPVAEGTIYNTPSKDSISAALDSIAGTKPVGNATYFFNPQKALGSWIVNNKTLVVRIGNHVFYK